MKPLSFQDVKRTSLMDRKSKVSRIDFAKVVPPGSSAALFLDSFPHILAGSDFRKISEALVNAKMKKLPIIWCMGAHVTKVGLTPILIDLMEQQFISAIALNGAGIIHDVEVALAGKTSEDVPEALETGTFGMALETAKFINEATLNAYENHQGLGESIGAKLVRESPPYLKESLLASAFLKKIPVTVHVAIGGDIVHMHPEASGEALGAASFRDFQIFCGVISKVAPGSVILNIGSAVVLPVVIEKAIAVSRNLGYPVEGFIGVNFDFIAHYRSQLNPVERAKTLKGEGYQLIGHHEILIPLLALAIKELWGSRGER